MDPIPHAAEPDLAPLRPWWRDLSHWLTVARDYDRLALFDGPNQLGESVFRFSYAYIHCDNRCHQLKGFFA